MDEVDVSLGYKNISKTPRSNTRKPGLFHTSKKGKSISGRSTQSALVIYKTLFHTVESFGAPIPVQVTEALAFSDRNTSCSANISDDGWAWFVIGRRLLIWQVIGSKHAFGSNCKELTLPPSDLAYSANLISVFSLHKNQTISCVVVSPEGLIRYWPNISNEGISIESNANLQGQECEIVKRIHPIGFIVATTTATILLIETSNIGGRHSIISRQLIVPSRWLGGIGRRFSSILFGGIHSSQNNDAKLIRLLTHEIVPPVQSTGANSYHVFVLAGYELQKWSLCLGETDKLVFQCNLEPIISENFVQTVWNASEEHDIHLELIDMQILESSGQNIVILATASNLIVTNDRLNYALVLINVDGDAIPTRTSSFFLLKNIDFSVFHPNHNAGKINLLTSNQSVYMYNHRYIVSSPVVSGYDEADVIDLPETNILGGTIVNRVPIFFSRIHGFVSVSPSDILSPFDFTYNSSFATEMNSLTEKFAVEESDVEDPTLYKDTNACLKAAFLFYVSKKSNQAKTMINEVFPVDETPAQVDATLDLIAIKVSMDLINDVPAKDPRWADIKSNEKINLNSTLSLQIQSQLEEKQQALDWYLSFLREMGLWHRLGAVMWNDVTIATSYIFAEQAEKLITAMVLKKLQNKYPHLLESVIKDVVKCEQMVSSSLTAFDLFYRKVSIVHKALMKLCVNCEDYVCKEHSIQSVIKMIGDTNSILLQVIEEIAVFRQEKKMVFVPNENALSAFNVELLFWTAANSPNGLRDSLMLQAALTYKYGIKNVGTSTQRQELLNQLTSLTSIILEGWKIHVDSVSNRKVRHEFLLRQYENERLNLLQPFMELEEYELAANLAEKYSDFTVLVQICDKTKDTKDDNRLMYYMDKYERKDFPQFLFSWYVREKKQGELLKQFRGHKKYHQALVKFLIDHPMIAWLHSTFCDHYDSAAETLLNLAFQELESMKRKKNMLTLGKLALLASGTYDANVFDKVNNELNLLSYQEDLPDVVLDAFGHDFETMRVFLPAELIRFYICDENTTANEFDFSKALDLLHFIEDEIEQRDLRYEIWFKSIVRDAWPESNADIDEPVDYIRRFLFFRIINFGLEKGTDVLLMLPPLERLLQSEELDELIRNTTFQYLLKIGYEYYAAL